MPNGRRFGLFFIRINYIVQLKISFTAETSF